MSAGAPVARTVKRSLELVPRVLEGNVRAIARLITRAEAGGSECRPALAEIYRRAGRAHVVGVTGVPGAGKSTLVCSLAMEARKRGRRLGVVALDPTSPFTGGAILGDRIRMNDLTADSGVFIRSMATRGALGGLARATFDAVDILDAAGFELVLVETVGVGQDEVDIVKAAHTVVVASAPGLGDDVQAIKAGILEIADVHVVTKGDRPDSNRTVQDLKNMMGMGLRLAKMGDWWPPVVRTSAETGEGMAQLLEQIDRHAQMLQKSGAIEQRRRRIAEMRVLKIADDLIRARYAEQREGALGALLERVIARQMDPYAAARELLSVLTED